MKYSIIFLCVVVVKLFINASKYFQAKYLRRKYQESLTIKGKNFDEYIPQAKKLLVDIGAGKMAIPIAQRLGYQQIATSRAVIVDNLSSARSDIVGVALSLFDETVGTYRMRMLDSISPVYWIETLIFLPARALTYLGFASDSIISKLFQFIYWIATPLLIVVRTELYQQLLFLLQQAK